MIGTEPLFFIQMCVCFTGVLGRGPTPNELSVELLDCLLS